MYVFYVVFFFFKQKTAYEMRISDWSSDVCSSDLAVLAEPHAGAEQTVDDDMIVGEHGARVAHQPAQIGIDRHLLGRIAGAPFVGKPRARDQAELRATGAVIADSGAGRGGEVRRTIIVALEQRRAGVEDRKTDEHTSELQSL